MDLSRRSFLTKGAAVVAGSSIIAIPALSVSAKEAETSASMPGNVAVYTDDTQTLTNKTISAANNILGTDALNIREFTITGVDITDALNDALFAVNSTGGQILIPHGNWVTDGDHVITQSITIEGVGFNAGVNTLGTTIKLNAEKGDFMFKLLTDRRNVSFKNFEINLENNEEAIGFWLTNSGCTPGGYETCKFIYSTCIENVKIYGGAFGIKVESIANTQFECILNRFERLMFIGCRTAFYCNTVNSGFTFDNCYFYIPTITKTYETGGTALDCYVVGNLALDHCLFVGTQVNEPLTAPSDGSSILKTVGLFNNISFYDCQDENVQFAYQNDANNWNVVSLNYKNCLIQSHFQFNSNGSVTLDACRCGGMIYDATNGIAKVYLKGAWNFFSYDVSDPNNPFQVTTETAESHVSFTNVRSRIIYENVEVNAPVIKGIAQIETGGYYIANATRGAVTIPSGTNYVQVYNNTVSANSLVFLQLRTYDSGGAKIREVDTYADYFVIYLTQNAATNLSVGFFIENQYQNISL